MRTLGAVLLLLVTSFFAMTAPSVAQSSVRQCPGVDLTGPADGAVLDPGYRANFTWDSEPRGTASREWVSVRVDLNETSFSFEDAKKAKADPRSYKGFARGRPGVYAWAVIFYDRNGRPICQSEARTYVVVGGGFASLSGASDGTVAAVKAALGRYVVKLAGSSYAGAFNREVASNNYDDLADATGAFDWKAQGYTGLDIHGNDNNNKLKGSNQGDNIFGYGGNDEIRGRDGNDHIEGGDESCGAFGLFGGCHAGDNIDGGAGDDQINGGNEGCAAVGVFVGCSAGDEIHGGAGNDVINGGNEGCLGLSLFGCSSGDEIYGDAGNDTINGQGGDDYVEGNAGDDTINGGDNWDDLHGNAGDDVIHGNDGNDHLEGNAGQDQLFGDADNDTLDGGANNDTLDGGPGFDTGTGGTGSDTCSSGGFSSCP